MTMKTGVPVSESGLMQRLAMAGYSVVDQLGRIYRLDTGDEFYLVAFVGVDTPAWIYLNRHGSDDCDVVIEVYEFHPDGVLIRTRGMDGDLFAEAVTVVAWLCQPAPALSEG